MNFVSQNLPPLLFLALLVVCALMIAVAAVLDWLPEREPKATTDGDATDEKEADENAADGEEPKAHSRLSKLDKKKAKAEAQARKKEERLRKKAEKAATKGKGKTKGKKDEEKQEESPAAPAPEAAEEVQQSEPIGETIDFSMPE